MPIEVTVFGILINLKLEQELKVFFKEQMDLNESDSTWTDSDFTKVVWFVRKCFRDYLAPQSKLRSVDSKKTHFEN